MPSPQLYAAREDGAWVVHEAATGARLPLSPLLEACLAAFDGGRTRAAALRALTAWPAAAVSALIDALVAAGVLVSSTASGRGGAWQTWGPVARWFHFATRDVPVRARSAPTHAAPSPVQRRRALTTVSLPLPVLPGALHDALVARRTWRQLATSPVSLQDAATLLGVTFGVQAWADAGEAGPSALKTSPSGGARHSLEAYVCVRRVTGVPPGLYHYRADSHRLDLLRPGCRENDLARFLPGQDGYHQAPLVCVMASSLARVAWRYPHARAYRVILTEAGHLAQTFALAATALGLASFSSGALADSAIEEAFSLSPTTCPVVYAVGAAHRPRGVVWAPYAHAPAPPRRLTRLGRHLARPRS